MWNKRPGKAPVTWEDVSNWTDELYKQHGYQCHFQVWLAPPGNHQLQSSVEVELTKHDSVGNVLGRLRNWKRFDKARAGDLERVALGLVSEALMEVSRQSWKDDAQLRLF